MSFVLFHVNVNGLFLCMWGQSLQLMICVVFHVNGSFFVWGTNIGRKESEGGYHSAGSLGDFESDNDSAPDDAAGLEGLLTYWSYRQ